MEKSSSRKQAKDSVAVPSTNMDPMINDDAWQWQGQGAQMPW